MQYINLCNIQYYIIFQFIEYIKLYIILYIILIIKKKSIVKKKKN